MAAFYAIIASMFLMSFIAIGMKAVTYTVQGITQKQSVDLTADEQEEYARALELDGLRQAKANATLDETQSQRLDLLEAQKPRREFSYVDQTTLVWIICAVVFFYAIAGGLEAAMYTDLLQGIFIIVLSIILIPFGLAKVNTQFGGAGLRDSLATISVLIVVNVTVQANQLNAIGAAKTK